MRDAKKISIVLENDRFVLCIDYQKVISWNEDEFKLIVHKINALTNCEFNNVEFIFPYGRSEEYE